MEFKILTSVILLVQDLFEAYDCLVFRLWSLLGVFNLAVGAEPIRVRLGFAKMYAVAA